MVRLFLVSATKLTPATRLTPVDELHKYTYDMERYLIKDLQSHLPENKMKQVE